MWIEFRRGGGSSEVFVWRRLGIMNCRGPAALARPYVIEPEGFGQGGDCAGWDGTSRAVGGEGKPDDTASRNVNVRASWGAASSAPTRSRMKPGRIDGREASGA